VVFEHARFFFPHLARDFGDGFIDGLVKVFGFRGRFDGHMVGAEENDFGDLAIVLDIEDGLGLDDPGVFHVEVADFADGVIAHGIGEGGVAGGDGDLRGIVRFFHDLEQFFVSRKGH
jgi:hypothetical protein